MSDRELVLSLPDGQAAVPGNRWDLVPDARPVRQPFVSVIVPYYQARDQLDLVLEGLALQDYPPDEMEIIVVDDGSAVPLELAADSGRIRTLRQEDHGFRAAAARNLGASQARGELLCFLDQDTVPGSGYLRRLIRLPAALPDALVVGRRRHVDLRGWTPTRLRSWLSEGGAAPEEFAAPGWLSDAYRASENLLVADDTSYRFVISAVMCCSASLFREIGGFDESFTRYGGEDWELAFRAYNAGAVLAYEPAAVAWHDGPDWAGRGDRAEREREQAEQNRALARLLPQSVRDDRPKPTDQTGPTNHTGPSGRTGPAELVVVWTGTAGIEPARLRTAVRALLDSSLRPAVYLDPDPGCAPPADVLARALDVIHLTGDCEPTPDDLARIRKELRSGSAGRVLLARAGSREPVLTGLTVRALRRAERWQAFAPEADLIKGFFGQVDLSS